MSHARKLRKMAAPFVMATWRCRGAPSCARWWTGTDLVMLAALGAHLGHLASSDLARRT
ncbi:MAG: hypothetical protein ACYDH5_16425 [Acidimicrobiales bacterium]